MHTRALFAALVLVTCVRAQQPPPQSFDVPELNHITIDGDAADWGRSGFHVDVMTSVEGDALSPADFDPSFRLGWNDQGLLVLITVLDDSFVEKADKNAYQHGDSIELLASPRLGAEDLIHIAISPGMSGNNSELKIQSFDWRKQKPREPVDIQAARQKCDGGYRMEVLLPWKNFARTAERNLETALQIHVNDLDNDSPIFRTAWYPLTPSEGRNLAMYALHLTTRPSPPIRAVALGAYDDQARITVHLVAATDSRTKSATILSGTNKLAKLRLTEHAGRPTADFTLPMPPVNETYQSLKIRVGGKTVAHATLGDARVWRAQKLMTYSPRFNPPVFAGNDFPPCDYENPMLAERYLGPYHIKTTFYDAQYNVVTAPTAPGRYGAVIDIIPDTGRPLRRFSTLFHQPSPFYVFNWWYQKSSAMFSIPEDLEIDTGSVAAQSGAIGTYLGWKLQESLSNDANAAALLAGLFETPKDSPPRGVSDDVCALDRQWWVGLKRKLNGMQTAFPNGFVCPYKNEGAPARTLRAGTPQEAAIKPEAINNIDSVLRAWEEASKEPFAVCLVRNGVIFFERGYGERFGQPMTVDTKSWMASISKFLSGVSMMTLVDQGLVDLDVPLDRYLPQLRGIEVKTPLTVRHCFTHTNGLALGISPPRMYFDHYGDEMNDYENVIAGYYPYLEVGTRHAYNGCGYAVAGKVIEEITGEALPQFFQKHMWGPLGCTHTDEIDMSARTMSTPRDVATLAQMLLNKGAYGDMRFFKEETFEKFLPVTLAPYVSFPAENLEWGIGSVWMPEPGLGPKTFGHGAASAATLRIDPDHQLIVVMCRNTAGPRYSDFHPQFIKAIADGLVE